MYVSGRFKFHGNCPKRFHIHQNLITACSLLCFQLLSFFIYKYSCSFFRNQNQLFSSKTIGGVYAVYMLYRFCNHFKHIICYPVCPLLRYTIVNMGILINFVDGRSWYDIMKLVKQHTFPTFIQLLLCVISAQNVRQRGQPFRPGQFVFQTAVCFLIVCLGCIGSSVVFQIQFSIPGVDVAVRFLHIFMHPAEEIFRLYSLYFRQARNHVHGSSQLQHIPGNTAASIPVAVGDQSLAAQFLVLKFLPASNHRMRCHHTIIGGISGV